MSSRKSKPWPVSRRTVSLPELASLGVFHGTLARIRRFLGREMHVELRHLKRDPARRDSLLTAPLVVRRVWPRDMVKLVLASVVAAAMIIALATGGPAKTEADSTLVTAVTAAAVHSDPPKVFKRAKKKSPPARAINKSKPRKRAKRARKRAKRRKRRR